MQIKPSDDVLEEESSVIGAFWAAPTWERNMELKATQSFPRIDVRHLARLQNIGL